MGLSERSLGSPPFLEDQGGISIVVSRHRTGLQCNTTRGQGPWSADSCTTVERLARERLREVRDPATIGKSAGIVVEPTSIKGSDALGTPIRGSAREIADILRGFGAAGFTNVELLLSPPTVAAVDAMAPVLELLDAD